MRPYLLVGLLVLAATPASAQTFEEEARELACPAEHRAAMSARLEELRTADQADRASGIPGPEVFSKDRERRREVAAIFAEGCFETGRDYHAAAQIFQHGETPEHYYQTYVWASRAVQLGEADAGWLIPRAIDRYLMNLGYKQLFATNFAGGSYAPELAPGEWCLWPTVASFSYDSPQTWGVGSVDAQLERLRTRMNASGEGGECARDLPDPPTGMFPGIW